MNAIVARRRNSSHLCERRPFADNTLYFDAASLPQCACGGSIRPDIVWFGEMPHGMQEIKHAVRGCHLFLTIGSSGSVYPAAGLIREINYRKQMGEDTRSVYVGLERPENADLFDEILLGKAGDLLPGLFEF